MRDEARYELQPIGFVRSPLKHRGEAPRQGYEGAPDAWVELKAEVLDGLEGVSKGDDLVLITWFHQSRRDVLLVHPRGDTSRPLTGVFATRAPDRPNPIGLHRVKVLDVDESGISVEPLEAIDGTPVLDIKPVLGEAKDW